jgi:hypothetical protein
MDDLEEFKRDKPLIDRIKQQDKEIEREKKKRRSWVKKLGLPK